MDANLLVTYDPNHSGKASEEAKAVLEEAGAKEKFLDSPVDGVFFLHVSEPKDVVRRLNEICRAEPEKFGYTFRWIPIEKWCSSDVDELAGEMKAINSKIGDDEKWKMELSKRGYDAHSSTELIRKLTDSIEKRNVDLKNPEKIVKIEIIGDMAGISLLNRDELLDVHKLKAG